MAENLDISEEEAFVIGNLAKYWAYNLLNGRKVFIKSNNDIIYSKYSYRSKFLYSGYAIVNSKPFYIDGFNKELEHIRKAKYKVLDLDSENVYDINDSKIKDLDNYILIRKSHLPKGYLSKNILKTSLVRNNIKIFLTDSISKTKPDRECNTNICKEILDNINNSKKSIDMAIYGYSTVPAIENALKNALKSGVKMRLIYDMNSNMENIYPNTFDIISMVSGSNHDGKSIEVNSIMHNKFYIFDERTVITGSANLSHTDMSGFNTNSIVSINSSELAKIYLDEFNQMYNGKFHNDKISKSNSRLKVDDIDLEVYFSPQDKSITNLIIPLIRKARNYIYIPTFVLTEKRVVQELLNAKSRGVDVKIIIDALNASIKHSKHKELRIGGLAVKTENYAGKMHSKSMIIDDEYTIIGSMNFSNSGENKNDENLILIKDSNVAKFYRNFFLYQWDKIDNKWLYQM